MSIQPSITQARHPLIVGPSELLRVEITLVPQEGGLSVSRSEERPHLGNVNRFQLNQDLIDPPRAILVSRGFHLHVTGHGSISATIDRAQYEALFQTKLALYEQPLSPIDGSLMRAVPIVDVSSPPRAHHVRRFYFPPDDADWTMPDDLKGIVEDVHIQWPSIPCIEPAGPALDYYCLGVPDQVSRLCNANLAHEKGITGKGVKVAIIDSGFFTAHPYFQTRRYDMSVVLGPRATNPSTDPDGHGTAVCANLFAIAPDITFVGVKMRNDNKPEDSATLVEAFKVAVDQKPDIISISRTYDLRIQGALGPIHELPDSLKPLETDIVAAVASGIVVVVASGNGEIGFPGMMRPVISVGGTFVAQDGTKQASDFASAFDSVVYPGRHVPDVTGLVGLMNHGQGYIELPVQPSCLIDVGRATPPELGELSDKTAPDDGWCTENGTSAAAPQVAGVCALLKQLQPSLQPGDVAALLVRTARPVITGHANPLSNAGKPLMAGPGNNGATGSGLVDAFAAVNLVGQPGPAIVGGTTGQNSTQLMTTEDNKMAIFRDSGVFGSPLHMSIGDAAAVLMQSDTAKARVAEILAPLGADVTLGSREVAVWADDVKRLGPNSPRVQQMNDGGETLAFLQDPRNHGNSNWHFANVPAGAGRYDPAAFPPPFTDPNDVVQMIVAAMGVLADNTNTRFSPLNALRLLVHLIGDIHQPLHVGCSYIRPNDNGADLVLKPDEASQENLKNDVGGNILVTPSDKVLHAIWDDGLSNAEPDTSVTAESSPTLTGSPTDWPARWATQSIQAAFQAYEGLTVAGIHQGGGNHHGIQYDLDMGPGGMPAYNVRCTPIISAQIDDACLRLARTLDTLLG